jgi:hypothetical protein
VGFSKGAVITESIVLGVDDKWRVIGYHQVPPAGPQILPLS